MKNYLTEYVKNRRVGISALRFQQLTNMNAFNNMSLSKEQDSFLGSEQAAQSHAEPYRERNRHAPRAGNGSSKTFIAFTIISSMRSCISLYIDI
jgi:hypothetical protein